MGVRRLYRQLADFLADRGEIPFNGLGWTALIITIGVVLIGRAISVYPICLVFRRSRWAIPASEQHVLWWGGLQGALALALALALPPTLRAAVVNHSLVGVTERHYNMHDYFEKKEALGLWAEHVAEIAERFAPARGISGAVE